MRHNKPKKHVTIFWEKNTNKNIPSQSTSRLGRTTNKLKGMVKMKAMKINEEQANKIIETREPIGSFYVERGESFVGIDNSTGDCFVEEFKDKETCIAWLEDTSLIYHTELDYGKTLKELKEDEPENELKSFEVIVIEKLVTAVKVKAKNEDEAQQKVEDMYDTEKIVLDYDDLSEVIFKVDHS